MEKLLGTWRQLSHKALINGQWCEVTPCEEVIWKFSESGILTQSSGDEIHAVHLVSSYMDADVIIIRHNFTNVRVLYSVRFHPDGRMILTSFRKSGDRILLVRSEELGVRSEERVISSVILSEAKDLGGGFVACSLPDPSLTLRMTC